jgi:hypothetical protein
MKRLQAILFGWVILCLVLPPVAWAADGTIGTNGPVMIDKSTNRAFCSKSAEGPVVVMANATKSFNVCTTLTLSSTDIGATTGTGNATYLSKWSSTATGTGTTDTLGNSVISDDGTNAVIGATGPSTGTATVSALARLDVRGALANTVQETLLSLSKRNDADRGWKFVSGKFIDTVWGQYSLRIGPQAVNNYNGHFVVGMGAGVFRVGAGRPFTEDALTDFIDRFAILNNGNVCIGSIDCATPLAVNSGKTFSVDTSGNVAAANITATPGASKVVQSLATSNKIDTGWIDTGTGTSQLITGADSRLTDARASTNTLYATDGIVFVSTATVTATDTLTQSGTASATASKTATSSALQTASTTLTATSSVTATGTFAATGTYTASGTVTQSMSATVTVTGTVTASVTDTYMATATATATKTASGSATATATSSMTQTYSSTFTRTATGTGTRTFTQNGVQNLSVTQTVTITGTATVSATATITGTRTETSTTTATSAAVSSDPTIASVQGYAMVPGGDRFIAQDTECSGYFGYAPVCDCAAGTPVTVTQGTPWTLYFGGSGATFSTWMPPGKIRIWQWMAAPSGGSPALSIDVGVCDSATYTFSTTLGTVGWSFSSAVFAQRYAEIEVATGTTFPVNSGLCFKYYNGTVGAPAAITGVGHITRIYAPYLPATQRGQ